MRLHPLAAGCLATVATLSLAATAAADSASDAEAMVRTLYYEGVPFDAASRLDADAVAHLAGLLFDPQESAIHGNVVMALGMSGNADAIKALRRYAKQTLKGEVDRGTFRARLRVALAMGHLARDHDQALRWLLHEHRHPEKKPSWSFRHHRGDALAELLHEQVLSGLGISGAGEAATELDAAAVQAKGNGVGAERRRRHVQHARKLRDRVSEEGPEATFGQGVTQ